MDIAKHRSSVELSQTLRQVRGDLTLAEIGGVLLSLLDAAECAALALHLTERPMTKEQLLPRKVRRKLLTLGETVAVHDPICSVKFFYPDFSWSWYPLEWDGEDLFYGFVDGDFPELGTFSLSELLTTRGQWGLPIERDLYFRPTPLSELRKKGS